MTIMGSLERARRRLNDGSPADAVRNLPPEGRLPAAFRAERNYLEAEGWRQQGFFNRAERLYARVWTSRVLKDDPALWIEAGLALAACRRSLGAVPEARRYLTKVRAIVQPRKCLNKMRNAGHATNWKVFLGELHLEEALVDRAAGLHWKSLRSLSSMLKRHIIRKEWGDAAFVLWAMGGAMRLAGDLQGSVRAFKQSRTMARRAGDSIGAAYALLGMGGAARIGGSLADSARYYAEAGRNLAKTQDIFGRAYAECGLANALRQLGRLRPAEIHYLRAHRLYSLLGDEVDLAYVEWGLGKVWLSRGEPSRAAKFLSRALYLFRRHHENRGIVLAGIALAQALHARGRSAEGELLFKRSYLLASDSKIYAHLEVYT